MKENFVRRVLAAICAVAIVCSLNFCEAAKKIVAVMPLENVSGYGGEQRVAEIMTEYLITAIHSSGNYTVVERTQMAAILREHGFQNLTVDPNKAVELGKLSGADYTIVGKVTLAAVVDNPTATAVSGIGNLLGLGDIGKVASGYTQKYKGKIALEFRFVDNKTGEIIITKTIEGSKTGSSAADAINNSCKKASENFLGELDDVNPFRARVAEISGTDIYIDCGSESGLRRGETLIVAREGSPIVINGKIVGMKHTEVGKVKVVEVNSEYAVCRAEKNAKDIRKGDVVKRK